MALHTPNSDETSQARRKHVWPSLKASFGTLPILHTSIIKSWRLPRLKAGWGRLSVAKCSYLQS